MADSPEKLPDSILKHSSIPSAASQKCAACHQETFDTWLSSQHAWANRLMDPSKDAAAFSKEAKFSIGDASASIFPSKDHFQLAWANGQEKQQVFSPEAVIGISPLRQFLVPFPKGRWQVFPMAWDPIDQEWFYVFGKENRDPQEWGHWFKRGNNWNSQCASCHMSGFEKGYDPQSDSYQSRWKEMGVSCLQCHGEMNGHPQKNGLEKGQAATVHKAQDSCASCHSRREELTGRFHPGESFEDHYRLILADQEGVYYPDGQVHQENFEYGSLLLSRMGMKGVTCLDCHDPHSGKLRLPVEDNSLCLSCHQAPTKRGAIPIDALAHSHHAPDSKGNQCIACHMPETPYMVRDPRRDHGFTTPDPLLTQELGIPNACNRCHADQSPAWAVKWTQQWYGAKMDRLSRRRARVIARAQKRDLTVLPELLSLAKKEENPAWQATLLSLLAAWAADPKVEKFLQEYLPSQSPLVRSAAVRALQNLPGSTVEFHHLQQDPARLVRLDILWASVIQGKVPDNGLHELVQYLQQNSDQPQGALKQAQFAMAQGNKDEAITWIRRSAEWDRSSAFAQFMKGRLLNLLGNNEEAMGAFQEATRIEPKNPDYAYSLALFYGELGQDLQALELLKKTVELDPAFGRAWYNLGLSYAHVKQIDPAIQALEKAEKLLNDSPEPPYAMATLYLNRGAHRQAREALERALKKNPQYTPARDLLSQIPVSQ